MGDGESVFFSLQLWLEMHSSPPEKLSGGALVSRTRWHLCQCASCTACGHICCRLDSSAPARALQEAAALWQRLLGTLVKWTIIVCCQEACCFRFFSPLGFWLDIINGNPMFSCVCTWTEEVLAVHAGWLQSPYSLTAPCFTASWLRLHPHCQVWAFYGLVKQHLFFLAAIGIWECFVLFFCSRSYTSTPFFWSKMMNVLSFCLIS